MKSIYGFEWITDKCKNWLFDNCDIQDCQIEEDMVIVEGYNYASDILAGLKENGFETLKDFILYQLLDTILYYKVEDRNEAIKWSVIA